MRDHSVGRDGDLFPAFSELPLLIEEARCAVRRAEEPEVAIADGEHGCGGVIELVGDAGSFVDDEQ